MTVRIAFYKGRRRLFNRLTAWWTRGPYSHCELIAGCDEQGRALCWSSSFMDGGVRLKAIRLVRGHWDVLEIEAPDCVMEGALDWFESKQGSRYDVPGLFGFIWRATGDSRSRWFCSEAVAEALKFKEAWRLCPNTLAAVLSRTAP